MKNTYWIEKMWESLRSLGYDDAEFGFTISHTCESRYEGGVTSSAKMLDENDLLANPNLTKAEMMTDEEEIPRYDARTINLRRRGEELNFTLERRILELDFPSGRELRAINSFCLELDTRRMSLILNDALSEQRVHPGTYLFLEQPRFSKAGDKVALLKSALPSPEARKRMNGAIKHAAKISPEEYIAERSLLIFSFIEGFRGK